MKNGYYQILHVEDDERLASNYGHMVHDVLHGQGLLHEITCVDAIDTAYRVIGESWRELDLILLDISLDDANGRNGLSLVQMLRQSPWKSIPVFVVSANVEVYKETLDKLIKDQSIMGYSPPLGTWVDKLADILLGKEVNILHLSDIHNGKFFAYNHLVMNRETVLDNLCRKLGHIDLAVISGDLSSTNSQEDYTEAVELLGALRNKLSLPHEHFVFVPGNHDHNLAARDSRTFRRYLEFTEGFYNGRQMPGGRYPGRDLEHYGNYEQVFDELFSIVAFPEQRTLIVGFNSVNHLDFKTNRGKKCPVGNGEICGRIYGGEISAGQLEKVDRELKWLYDTHPDYKNYVKCAVFHHNVFEPAHVEKVPWCPTLMNQGNFFQLLSQHGFRFALHGHLHYKEVHFYKEYHWKQGINVISTGTFSGKDRAFDTDFCANKLTYRVSPRGEISVCRLRQITLPKDGLDWQESKVKLELD